VEVNASFLVIFVQLWNEELLEHVQIHDTGNGRQVVKLFLKHPVFYAYNGWRYLPLSWFTFGDYFVVYFMSFNRNFSHSSHRCVSVVLYLLFILHYSVLHRQRNLPRLMRSEKTATRVNNE